MFAFFNIFKKTTFFKKFFFKKFSTFYFYIIITLYQYTQCIILIIDRVFSVFPVL